MREAKVDGTKTKTFKIVQQHFDVRWVVDIDGGESRHFVASQAANCFQIGKKDFGFVGIIISLAPMRREITVE